MHQNIDKLRQGVRGGARQASGSLGESR